MPLGCTSAGSCTQNQMPPTTILNPPIEMTTSLPSLSDLAVGRGRGALAALHYPLTFKLVAPTTKAPRLGPSGCASPPPPFPCFFFTDRGVLNGQDAGLGGGGRRASPCAWYHRVSSLARDDDARASAGAPSLSSVAVAHPADRAEFRRRRSIPSFSQVPLGPPTTSPLVACTSAWAYYRLPITRTRKTRIRTQKTRTRITHFHFGLRIIKPEIFVGISG
jgi:hypothetical protein